MRSFLEAPGLVKRARRGGVVPALVLAVLCCQFGLCSSKLIGAAVLPHGDFAYDPTLLSDPAGRAAAEALHRGSLEAGAQLASLQPEVVVVTTPHGLAADWDLGVYVNSGLQGEAAVGRDLEASFGRPFPTYAVRVGARGDPALARAAAAALANATLLKGWNDVLPLPLHWGEVLPLRFLLPQHQGAGAGVAPELQAAVVAVGLPLSRYNHSAEVAPGILEIGRQLGLALQASEKRVALLVSTDLAHTHWPNTSFGFSPHAAPFDEAVGRWARHLDARALMLDARALVDQVDSCGWLGAVLLQGALEAVGGREQWEAVLSAPPAHPTYYGMLAAHFTPRAPPPASAGGPGGPAGAPHTERVARGWQTQRRRALAAPAPRLPALLPEDTPAPPHTVLPHTGAGGTGFALPSVAYVHKHTYATSDPAAAASFAVQYLGAAPGASNHHECGSIFTVSFPTSTEDLQMHFVYNPHKAPGRAAMNATELGRFVERQLGRLQRFEQYLDNHVGLVVPSLDPFVERWQRAGLPFICRTWCCAAPMPQFPAACPRYSFNRTSGCEVGCYVEVPHGSVVEMQCGIKSFEESLGCLTRVQPQVFDLCSPDRHR